MISDDSYDETPKKRGPRKAKGMRIRYVEEDERGGGTTEQGMRMGPVSVQRAAKERGGSQAGAATNTAARPRMRAMGAVRLRTETPTKNPTP